MTNNLKFKALFIAAVILICIYGIIGIPKSMQELKDNWQHNIRLGLDLKGGSHLVLQVQLQDAFKAEADSVIQRMKDVLTKANIPFADINRNDPQTLASDDNIQINVAGVPANKAGDFRTAVNENFGGVWNMTTVNSTDYRFNMKPTEALKLKQDALTQTI